MDTQTFPTFGRTFDAFLFDMDGTLINSIAATERVWGKWARKHGLDVEAFLPTMHGRRGIDTIAALNLPGIDPRLEALEVERGEIEDVEGVVAIDGAIAFLGALPADRWAIVTSAPIALARRRLAAAGIALPQTIVTAEDVKTGKPSPEGYLLAASRLGVDPARCLVFEDVEAGVKAGERAGAGVVVVTATHAEEPVTGHPSIASYRQLRLSVDASGVLTLAHAATS
ncbi:sugar-phosphatase [Rhizobium subbaraonis]|uniref:Sugar-phosphatase n=1 Tax=Rhizobium subbaraonis TaxID=908946 RepID=A0A285UGJ0_9HYPH|nr:HAD-IA family hydrolase [Rhizobium subbaraonis]SOC40922.1 sugar-phosphatase [Rhizobium subbaraonis]